MIDCTQILSRIQQGDPSAAEQLLALAYEELRKLAAQRLAREKPGQTLQATALAHEAYIRWADTDRVQHWNSRGHFFAATAEAIRPILIENARLKKRHRHGAGRQQVELDEAHLAVEARGEDLLALDEALQRLAQTPPAEVFSKCLHSGFDDRSTRTIVAPCEAGTARARTKASSMAWDSLRWQTRATPRAIRDTTARVVPADRSLPQLLGKLAMRQTSRFQASSELATLPRSQQNNQAEERPRQNIESKEVQDN